LQGTSVGFAVGCSLAKASEVNNTISDNANPQLRKQPLEVFINHVTISDAKLLSSFASRTTIPLVSPLLLLRGDSDATGTASVRTDRGQPEAAQKHGSCRVHRDTGVR